MEINKSSNFAHVTRLPSKHIHDTEKEYSRSFACNVLLVHVQKKCNEHKTAILTMAVVTVMWGSSMNGDACLWVPIV